MGNLDTIIRLGNLEILFGGGDSMSASIVCCLPSLVCKVRTVLPSLFVVILICSTYLLCNHFSFRHQNFLPEENTLMFYTIFS
uniref:Uncharacterized protein n=1 Tax=Rhizophora mucronata TaxID=61149 RepID=A0A2P2Q594_RHIMU